MRFAVHRHFTVPDHYDFMLDRGDLLATWRIAAGHITDFINGSPVKAERINDHRREYLDLKEVIDCGRGRVELYDSGDFQELPGSPGMKVYKIDGKIIKGILSLETAEDGWDIFILRVM
jgi:hypothetical protein